ncbi:DNA primase catalytic subunit [Infundibulicybe gibba]|nr:DNA primase catalytic subunit [Infundibulicybe gibba]
MLAFYRRLYPFKSIFTWLNHGHIPTRLFTHREFAFTLQGDVYLRYNSFNAFDELKKQVCQLNPTRFEIGPVYSARPRDKKTVRPSAFSPLLRELVFDIDMTDYDPVRTCCSGADICKRCWGFISAAVRVIDNAVRDQFGFIHLLWVYSGRRGIHLWVSDKEAMELTDDQRKALIGWMSVVHSSKESGKKPNLRGGSKSLPLPLQVAWETLNTSFVDLILEDQDCFAGEAGSEALLEYITDSTVTEDLRRQWANDPSRSSTTKWIDMKKAIKNSKGTSNVSNLQTYAEDIVLGYMYPRLDLEVSKHRNHLLKAPFCVHPKTGRVCVPLDPTRIEEFDPEKVPTLAQLLRELDAAIKTDDEAGDQAGDHRSEDWEKTSLKPYIEFLDKHNLRIMEQARRDKRGTGQMSLPFQTI